MDEGERILVFSHYNKNELLSEHVVYALSKIGCLFARVIFVSNSKLNVGDLDKLGAYCDKIIVRNNVGFDFGGYKDALLHEGLDSVSEYRSLTIMNDTCFGPIRDIGEIYGDMESRGIDFWGLTNHAEAANGMPGTNGPVPEHLQSYFLVFSHSVLNSVAFKAFWEGVPYYLGRDEVIQNCETRLTPLLTSAGFSHLALCDCSNDVNYNEDVAMNCPELLLDRGIPFFKIRRFKSFQYPRYLLKLLSQKTGFPSYLVFDYFFKTEPPSYVARIFNKNIYVGGNVRLAEDSNKSLAIHIHVFYIDVLEYILSKVEFSIVDFDIYFSVSSQELKEDVVGSSKKAHIYDAVKDIYVCENIGRNIYPWLKMQNSLSQYDYVLHLHTKKSPTADSWVGESWLDEVLDAFLCNLQGLVAYLNNNPKVGLIVPDVPHYFKYQGSLWGGNESECQALWHSLGCKKYIDFAGEKSPIFPVGFMFLYRPLALAPLWSDISIYEFPEEPLRNNRTILHAIERLPVYIAWDEGYDYRVAVGPEHLSSAFDYKVNVK